MAKRRGSIVPLFSLALCVFAVWLYFSPYMALGKLQKAAEAGDTQALNELVDFPAVRESVKEEIRTTVADGISDEGRGNPFAALGGMLAGALAGPVVDAFVTPTGIAALTRGERPDREGTRAASDDEDGRRVLKDVEIDRGYEGWGKFVIQYRDKDSDEERVALVMRREGLSGWRLVAVRLGHADEEN